MTQEAEMTEVSMSCNVCGGEVTTTSMTSEGTAAQCPCGRTTLVRLNQGHIELGPKPVGDPEAPSDGRDLRGGLRP